MPKWLTTPAAARWSATAIIRPARSSPASARPVERFRSSILPPYLRKTKAIEELIPWLYLKGVSTGDFSEALQALVGPQAAGLSDSAFASLMVANKRSLSRQLRRAVRSAEKNCTI